MPGVSPYETAKALGRKAPTHVLQDAKEDRDRLIAYDTYADIFHNVPTIFELSLQLEAGQETSRRFVPSARSIIEGTNRYLGQGLTWVPSPPAAQTSVDSAASAEGANLLVDEAMAPLLALFDREEFGAKFLSWKRWGLIRGDAMLHITGDPSKAEGSRIIITELEPGTYFAIKDAANAERITGCYIVNIILDDDDEEISARLEYQKIRNEEDSARFNGAAVGTIFTRLTFWELAGWDDRMDVEDLEPVAAPARFNNDAYALLLEGTVLPAPISAIPVYHWRNNRRGNALFGTSEIQGIETLINGINQTATDQEIAVALHGLGVYWTTSGRPVDSQGNETSWKISPAQMLELQGGGEVGRLQGLNSVQPSLDHLRMLKSEARETTGTPDIAVGSVDVGTAESGVALAIRLAPVVVKNAEKEEELRAKLKQMLYDLLNGFLPAYEGIQPNGVTVGVEFESPIPVNIKEWIENVSALVDAKVISAAVGRQILTARTGLTFPEDTQAQIEAEQNALLDAEGARLDAAVAGGGTEPVA